MIEIIYLTARIWSQIQNLQLFVFTQLQIIPPSCILSKEMRRILLGVKLFLKDDTVR
jgi:hypothetical protein